MQWLEAWLASHEGGKEHISYIQPFPSRDQHKIGMKRQLHRDKGKGHSFLFRECFRAPSQHDAGWWEWKRPRILSPHIGLWGFGGILGEWFRRALQYGVTSLERKRLLALAWKVLCCALLRSPKVWWPFILWCAWAQWYVTDGNGHWTQSLVPVCASHFRAACARAFLESANGYGYSIPALRDWVTNGHKL